MGRLTKWAHFLPFKTGTTLDKLAGIYIAEIVRLHGVPVSVVSDRDPRFVAEFGKAFHAALGTSHEQTTYYTTIGFHFERRYFKLNTLASWSEPG